MAAGVVLIKRMISIDQHHPSLGLYLCFAFIGVALCGLGFPLLS
jgi:hypothetical protein